MNWSEIFNTSHKRYDIASAASAAKYAGYKYFSWNGWVLDLHGNKMHQLPSEEGTVSKTLSEEVSNADLKYGSMVYCSWERLAPYMKLAAGVTGPLRGVRADAEGIRIAI